MNFVNTRISSMLLWLLLFQSKGFLPMYCACESYSCTIAMASLYINRVLSKYYVGELVDNELPVFNRERYISVKEILVSPDQFSAFFSISQFHKLVKQRVAMHLKEHNLVNTLRHAQ